MLHIPDQFFHGNDHVHPLETDNKILINQLLHFFLAARRTLKISLDIYLAARLLANFLNNCTIDDVLGEADVGSAECEYSLQLQFGVVLLVLG